MYKDCVECYSIFFHPARGDYHANFLRGLFAFAIYDMMSLEASSFMIVYDNGFLKCMVPLHLSNKFVGKKNCFFY